MDRKIALEILEFLIKDDNLNKFLDQVGYQDTIKILLDSRYIRNRRIRISTSSENGDKQYREEYFNTQKGLNFLAELRKM